jgi:hypothetical protein
MPGRALRSLQLSGWRRYGSIGSSASSETPR